MSGLLVARRSGITKHRASGGLAAPTEFFVNISSASSSWAKTGVNAAIGDVLTVIFCMASGSVKTISSIADSGGNTYTKQQVSQGSSGTNSRIEVWTAPVTTALTSGTVTATLAGGTATGTMDVLDSVGVTLTGILGANDTLNNTSTATPTGVGVSPIGAGILLGGISYSLTSAPSSGPGTGFTALTGASDVSGHFGAGAYRVVATAGTYTPVWGLAGAASHGAATIFLPSL